MRLGIDYLRYLDPRYAETPPLRARARDRAPRTVVAMAERLGPRGRDTFSRVLRALERGIPISPELERYIAGQRPDVVLVTPLIELGSPQMDHLAAARALGIRTALPVASWDHLSSEAVIRNVPDLLLVWNDIQKQEAVDMHGVSPDRVVVTGAHPYDQWFGRAPSRSPLRTCLRGPFWNQNREGTIRFPYLIAVNCGVLRRPRTLQENLRPLADPPAPEGGGNRKGHCFVEGLEAYTSRSASS